MHSYLLVSVSRLVVSYIALALKDLQISAISKNSTASGDFMRPDKSSAP